MNSFEHITGEIYRLKVPFYSVYTSVFVIVSGASTVIFDSGSNETDVTGIILPALKNSGFVPSHIAISHHHDDHSGGVSALAKAFPSAVIYAFGDELGEIYSDIYYHRFSDGDEICDGVEFLNLKGHTSDCGAIFDKRSKTLLSVDCFQLCGINKYGCGVILGADYLKSIDRILKTDVENIIASHEYVPLGAAAFGRENTEKYLTECRNYFEKIGIFVREHKNKKLEEIVTLYNRNSGLPPVPQGTFENFVDF